MEVWELGNWTGTMTGQSEKLSSGTRAALQALLHPQSIAVVGASSNPDTVAGLLFKNLMESQFAGTVLPVNRKHSTVQGLAAFADLASCPVVPDLAIICVPATAVIDVVSQAGHLGVKAACVISAGFAETGGDGAVLQDDLVREAASHGVRLVGPNCTGVLNGATEARFNATFSRAFPPPGRTSLLSQSGAIGLAVLEAAKLRGLGIGAFVSVGNSVDLACDDLLSYWGEDSATDLILLYLESVQDPARFVRIARQVSRHIPIVAVKAGRTEAGRRGAVSHTAALSGGDAAVDAMLHQAGVIRAESIEELLDLATLLSAQRSFKGPRVAIVTNGGGPGILAADACEANGLVVPELTELTTAGLRAMLPAEASVSNPVDMIASATAEDYGRAVRILAAAPEIDAVTVVFNTPLVTQASDVADELIAARAAMSSDQALIAVFMNADGPPSVLREAAVASFVFPENAARALGRSVAWAQRRGQSPGRVLRPEVDVHQVRTLMAAARREANNGWLRTTDAESLLGLYGIAVPRTIKVRTPGEAESAQAELGCTVVVKVAAAIHKSEVGGVRLGARTPAAAAGAVLAIRADLANAGCRDVGDEFLVQEQIESGLEMIVGVNRDPLLGPLIMVGLGGAIVELLGDVAVRLAPLTDDDVTDMVHSLRSYPLLTGYRGEPCLDVGALCQVLHRVSALVEDLPEIEEMDLNPVLVLEKGAVAVDVRTRIAHV